MNGCVYVDMAYPFAGCGLGHVRVSILMLGRYKLHQKLLVFHKLFYCFLVEPGKVFLVLGILRLNRASARSGLTSTLVCDWTGLGWVGVGLVRFLSNQ